MTNGENIPIACDLTAIPGEARQQHMEHSEQLFQSVQAIRQFPEGYAFVFENALGIVTALASFVENERHCCPFFSFRIEVTSGGGPVTLHLSGGEEVKEFVRTAFGDMLNLSGLFERA